MVSTLQPPTIEAAGIKPGTEPQSKSPAAQPPCTLTVIIPAFNEGDAVDRVVNKVRELRPDAEVLVVDDGSKDNTSEVARAAGARVVRHPYNKGNGAAVKTGLRNARGDVVLLLDADGQHPPEDINRVLAEIGEYDLVVGARSKNSETAWVRDAGNAIFNALATYLSGRAIPDLTSGFRAMKRDHIMEFIHLLPNLYSYPTTSTLAFIKAGYNVKFVPITARKGTGRSNTRIIRDGVRAIMIIFRMITLFAPMKIFLPLGTGLFLLGVIYGISNIFFFGINRIPNGSVLLILSSLFIFLFGLISEQIAAMRFESSQRLGVEEMLLRLQEQAAKPGGEQLRIANYELRSTAEQASGDKAAGQMPVQVANAPDNVPQASDGE